MNFILALTVGLLVYLALGTWLDANEFAAELPAFWQGVPMVIFIALITLGGLLAVSSVRKGQESTPLGISYRIALGIGLHNLGEGLAIGAAFAPGEAALGTFLILGFTLHNITEGVGIAAPICARESRPEALCPAAAVGRRPGNSGNVDRRLCFRSRPGDDFPGRWRGRYSAGRLGSRQAGGTRYAAARSAR